MDDISRLLQEAKPLYFAGVRGDDEQLVAAEIQHLYPAAGYGV